MLLTPPYSAGPATAQQRAMRIQVLLLMVQDLLSKEEAGELLDQRVHVLVSTQDLRHSTRKSFKLVGYYLCEEIPICLSMGTWARHIHRFERQYEKAFAKDLLFGADLIDWIHKCVHVFLHSCNTYSIEDVELGSLSEFGELNNKVKRVEWLMTALGWVEHPTPKE